VTDATQGDSGGPLVLAGGSDVLVGIVSRGPGRMCDRATVFTSVSHYIDWIHKVIKKYDGKKRSGK
jgi:secreted trypsin-like serine protease